MLSRLARKSNPEQQERPQPRPTGLVQQDRKETRDIYLTPFADLGAAKEAKDKANEVMGASNGAKWGGFYNVEVITTLTERHSHLRHHQQRQSAGAPQQNQSKQEH